MESFISFDGTTIAWHEEGKGRPVVLLHGFGVDGLGQFGHFERTLPLLEKRREMFLEAFGRAMPVPSPPLDGRPGLIPPLLAAGARVILPDMRGFGASSKPRDATAYANSAMARDVIALVDHLRLDAVDVVGFSMGAVTAARLLILRPPRIKSAILAGIGDYIVEGTTLDFPKTFPVPEYVPKPLTHKIWAEEGAKVLEEGEIVPGHLASANIIAARATGADPKVLAAVIRGAVAPQVTVEELNGIHAPVLVLNGKADVANQKTEILTREIPHATADQCEGDHHSTPYDRTFQTSVVGFLEQQWRNRHSSR